MEDGHGNGWTYTFADLRTDEELAVLPLTGVSFDRGISRVGAFSGYLSVLDQVVRDQDPWAATTPRRTALYVEKDDQVRWAGLVWGRQRAAGSYGLTLTGATFESLLAHWLLRTNATYTGQRAAQMMAAVVALVQGYPGGSIGLSVLDVTGSGASRDRTYKVEELRSVFDLLTNFTETQTPIEFRVDVTRSPSGGWTKQLLIGEPRLGVTYATSGRELMYPDGALLDFSDAEDGSAMDNTLIAVGDAPDAGGIELPRPTLVLRDSDVGSDEVAAGFPALTRGFTASGISTVPGLTDAATADLLSGLAIESVLTGLKVRTDPARGWPLGSWSPGDDTLLSILHPAYREWPGAPMERVVRILAEKVTPSTGTTVDQVELTVGDDALGHLPASVTVTAQLRKILARLTRLETR